MSTWNEHAERIKNQKTQLEKKREQRQDENPTAFGWEKTDEGTYRCTLEGCGKEYQRLPQCLRHINSHRSDGQTGLEEWS